MSSVFDMADSLERARQRLGVSAGGPPRAQRSDRGISRLSAAAQACMAEALSGHERPRTRDLLARIRACCLARGAKAPSRATVYKAMDKTPCPTYVVADLPPPVQAALYNLDAASQVPAHQVAFYCFNYGTLSAVSFAAGLPWLALHQARRMPGHRPKSRGLIEAVARVRGI